MQEYPHLHPFVDMPAPFHHVRHADFAIIEKFAKSLQKCHDFRSLLRVRRNIESLDLLAHVLAVHFKCVTTIEARHILQSLLKVLPAAFTNTLIRYSAWNPLLSGVRALGKGGVGVVYLAHDTVLSRPWLSRESRSDGRGAEYVDGQTLTELFQLEIPIPDRFSILCEARSRVGLRSCTRCDSSRREAGPHHGYWRGREDSGGIWLVSSMDYDLGYVDLEEKSLEPLENPFGPKVLPMS